jgi:AcrR family transcriptional regulator
VAVSVATTARGRRRREQILGATAQLVAAHGFHAVALTDIGAAAGVTGSAIYRHFASKQDIVVALLDRVVDDLLTGARAAVAAAVSADEALAGLIGAHVDFALRDRALIRVYDQEADVLPERDRRRLRATMRAYAAEWVAVLAHTRPDLPPEAARAAVHAAFGLVNSVADYRSALPTAELRALLVGMTSAALAAAAPDR